MFSIMPLLARSCFILKYWTVIIDSIKNGKCLKPTSAALLELSMTNWQRVNTWIELLSREWTSFHKVKAPEPTSENCEHIESFKCLALVWVIWPELKSNTSSLSSLRITMLFWHNDSFVFEAPMMSGMKLSQFFGHSLNMNKDENCPFLFWLKNWRELEILIASWGWTLGWGWACWGTSSPSPSAPGSNLSWWSDQQCTWEIVVFTMNENILSGTNNIVLIPHFLIPSHWFLGSTFHLVLITDSRI